MELFSDNGMDRLKRSGPKYKTKKQLGKRLLIECPELYVAYQDRNLNIKFHTAMALDRLGLTNRAIVEGEKALALSNWHWGHFLVSQIYRDIDDLKNEEFHLLEAISLRQNCRNHSKILFCSSRKLSKPGPSPGSYQALIVLY